MRCDLTGTGAGPVTIVFGDRRRWGLIFLVPFLDRSPRRRWQERKVSIGIAVVVFAALFAISVFVWINNPNGH